MDFDQCTLRDQLREIYNHLDEVKYFEKQKRSKIL